MSCTPPIPLNKKMNTGIALVGAEFEENLSTRYLSSALERSGLKVTLVQLNGPEQEERALAEILDLQPAVVGVSTPFQTHAPRFLDFIRTLRARKYGGHICLGGHFPTFEYDAILRDYPEVDSVVRHEGEVTFPELCQRVVHRRPLDGIPGLVVGSKEGLTVSPKRRLLKLDDMAFPDRRGEPHRVLGVPCAPILGSRGCYADCSFCCINAFASNAEGPRYRQRSPEDIVDEMKREHESRGVRLFVFHDDNFFVPSSPANIKRYSHFADCLEKAGLDGIGLVIKCRPNDVESELFSLLRSIGLIRAYVGIESNSQEGLVSLNRRISQEDNQRALSILNDLDVYHSFNVLLFDPEATLDGIRDNLDFMERFPESPSNFCRAEVYAGTPLKAVLEQQGRLRGNYMAWDYTMRGPKVEMLFRIASVAFAARNFKCDGAANLNLGIRFDFEVLKRFYPDVRATVCQEELRQLSSHMAQDSVDHLRRAVDFVESSDIHNALAVKDFTINGAQAIAAKDLEFVAAIKRLKRQMETAAHKSRFAVSGSAANDVEDGPRPFDPASTGTETRGE